MQAMENPFEWQYSRKLYPSRDSRRQERASLADKGLCERVTDLERQVLELKAQLTRLEADKAAEDRKLLIRACRAATGLTD